MPFNPWDIPHHNNSFDRLINDFLKQHKRHEQFVAPNFITDLKNLEQTLVIPKGLADIRRLHQSKLEAIDEIRNIIESYKQDIKLTENIPSLTEFNQKSYINDIHSFVNSYQRLGLSEEKISESIKTINNLPEQWRSLIKQSISPFWDFTTLTNFRKKGLSSAFKTAFDNINRAITDVEFIDSFELAEEEEKEEGLFEFTEEEYELSRETDSIETNHDSVSERNLILLPFRCFDEILENPEAMKFLDARDFEHFIAVLVDKLGFEGVCLTPASGDKGRDIIATKTVEGIPIIFAFECKRYKKPIGPGIMRALLGTVVQSSTKANKGVLVTTSTFTSGARKMILTEPALDGKDFDGVVTWLKKVSSK